MTDLVFFAGPVIVTEAHKRIDWRGRDVKIIPIVGEGSSNFEALAESLRDKQGRILPNLLKKYAPGIQPAQIALCAYSAGWGLLNKIAEVDEDRKQVTAMILSDACFSAGNMATGQGGTAKAGYVKFGIDAMNGSRLFVATTANTSPGSYLTGRQSFELVWNAVRKTCFCEPRVVKQSISPAPSGGWHELGNAFYWGDYTKPGSAPGQGSDIGHADHNAMSAAVWQEFLSPWLAGAVSRMILKVALGAALAVGIAALYAMWRKR
jgi:hypothetical protein